jgi:outer membrane protein assembly factor BamA
VKVQRSILFFMLLLFFCCFSTMAQEKYRLELNCTDKGNAALAELVSNPVNFSTKEDLAFFLKTTLVESLQRKGYLAISVDSMAVEQNLTKAWIFLGDQYKWGELVVDSSVLLVENNRQNAFQPMPGALLTMASLALLKETMLRNFEENGYPFASIQLDSSYFRGNELCARLRAVKGPLYRIDSLHVEGKLFIKKGYLQQYLALGGGTIYRKSNLDALSGRLLALGFVKESRPWDLSLLGTGASVNLYLEPQRSSRFNLLAGLMPSNPQLGGKMLLTGEADLDLKNTFGAGENFMLNWQQLQVKSPRLQIGFQKPYMFKSNAGVDFRFNLLKKDSSFININTRLGLQYEVSKKQVAKLFVQQHASNLIEVDTNLIKRTKKLPVFLDLRTTNIGAELQYSGTDYRFNPRKGMDLGLTLAGGIRKLLKNNSITSLKKDQLNNAFDFARLYDTMTLSATQFRMNVRLDKFIRLGQNATIRSGLQGGWINGKKLFLNEIFQLGGIKTLRGFDEESFYASEYAIATIEYRYLIGPSSYLFSFLDVAHLGRKSMQGNLQGKYAGIGVGLALETKSGLFNLAYAAGKNKDLPFNFREAKIHFGFVSLF